MQRPHTLRVASVLIAVVGVIYMPAAWADQPPEDQEQTVCGWIAERAAFALWSSAAGEPTPNAWRSVPGAEPVSHKTRDGRTLYGYKISAKPPQDATGPWRGFVLVAQGNAMLADQLLADLRTFTDRGVDVYVYDYRGYGHSEGNRRLKAIVSDYREIFNALSATENNHRFLYGISFGGLVLLNVIGGGATFDKAVIDSTPSRISHMGCPEEYDPVRNLPSDSSHLLVVSGKRDRVVEPTDTKELIAAAKSRGAQVVVSEEFAHPFMDLLSIHLQRKKMVQDFLFAPNP